MTDDPFDLPCNVFVELVTAYLDGALAATEVTRIENHLAECEGCTSVLEQFRMVIRQVGRLRDADVDTLAPSTRETLMAAFRDARGL